ncbi:MAG: tryptophan--tRNA ligase [Opitutales bacterium]
MSASGNPASSEKPIVLTCAQPSGNLHLGNYLGAIKNWVAMQDTYECFFGIVDLHAITVPYTPAELRANSLDCLAQYLSCGLDADRCHLFLQSHVTGHTELAWVLACLCPLGKLERMTQFKDKAAKRRALAEAVSGDVVENPDDDASSGGFVGSGLLFYPVLMAADILLYNADRVPVGEDQKQHLELTRDLAIKFNQTYSDTFKVPDIDIPKTGARVMSLAEPTMKMSKSDPNPNGCLYLVDDEKTLRKKVMSAVTDSGGEILAKPDKPGVSNLLGLQSALSGKTVAELETDYAGMTQYALFKEAVADTVVAALAPIRERYLEIREDKSTLQAVLKAGAEAAQKRAYKTLAKVYRKAGFVDRPR